MNTFEMTAVMLVNAVQNLDGIRNDGDTVGLDYRNPIFLYSSAR